jgi:hypothetical protein
MFFGPQKAGWARDAVELLLAEAALPLSYPEFLRGLDSNQQHAITHNFGPSM